MPIVVDRARPATRPTQGQFVEILQSETEPHVIAYTTDGVTPTPPVGLPTSDDRAHKTGNDANLSLITSLITDTFISWTITGDVVQGSKGNSEGHLWEGSTGTQGQPSLAEAAQDLSAGWVTGDFVELKFTFEHRKKSLLSIALEDDNGSLIIEGLTGGLPGESANGQMDVYLAGVARRDTVGTVHLKLQDITGNMQGDTYNFSMNKRPSAP